MSKKISFVTKLHIYLSVIGVLIFLIFLYFPFKYSQQKDKFEPSSNSDIVEYQLWNGNKFSWHQIYSSNDNVFIEIGSDTIIKKELLIAGYNKAIHEIDFRNAIVNDWFHYKLLIIGSIIFAFGFIIYMDKNTKDKKNNNFPKFHVIVKSDKFLISIAISTIIAFVIDIQIRQNLIVIDQLGLWIFKYIEPIINNGEFGITNYIGWEQILRLPSGYRNDNIFTLFHWSAFHILTVILYLGYLMLNIWKARDNRGNREKNDNEKNKLVKSFLFFFIHLTIISYAIMGTEIPSVFVVRIPFTHCFVPPLIVTIFYIIISFMVWMINRFVLMRFK